MVKNSFYKYIWILLFGLAVLASCDTSRRAVSTASESESSEYAPLDAALLWKIEGPQLEKPSYLFGTIHIIDEENFYWPKGTLAAIEETDKMIFEIDMNDMSDLSAQMALMPAMFMNGNKSLEDYLTEEEYEIVKDHFSSKGMPMFMIRRMKPMVASAMSEFDMDQLSFGTDNMKSYEFEFFELAQQRGMGVGGLETMEYQIGLFDSIPYADQAQMLVETIQSTRGDDALSEMIDMYRQQDIEAMYTMMSAEDESFQRILLFNRNQNWIPIMQQFMSSGPVFFAVGAGHLGGPMGVIHLLRQSGYTLTPISL